MVENPEQELEQLSGSPGCFICDNNGGNARSLGLKIFWNKEARTVHIPFVPDPGWCGYNKVVHGGLTAAVLDEAMAWVVRENTGDWAFTVDFHLRYKKAVEPDRKYQAVAGVVELGRKITTEARLYDENGNLAAVADAIFLPGKGQAKQQTA